LWIPALIKINQSGGKKQASRGAAATNGAQSTQVHVALNVAGLAGAAYPVRYKKDWLEGCVEQVFLFALQHVPTSLLGFKHLLPRNQMVVRSPEEFVPIYDQLEILYRNLMLVIFS
jgi:hypothetical protein